MIDIKDLRANPQKYIDGARKKQMEMEGSIKTILSLDADALKLGQELQDIRTQQNAASKDIAKLKGPEKQAAIDSMGQLKARAKELGDQAAAVEPQLAALLMQVPQPPDSDVPEGRDAGDNVVLRHWNSPWFDTSKSFEENKGFKPKGHIELGQALGLVDFERGVKMAGSRSYVLTGAGMRLHQAVLRFAFDFMVNEQGFTPVSVPVLVREEMMVGTGFFPFGKEQAYEVGEKTRGGGYDLYLTGTGEVGLMGLHAGDILDEATLPRKYITVSTCFRREAGAAGKDTAGLYRIHQFDKCEQVVLCRADEQESRQWHRTMIGYVEQILQRLELPYRLLQCCTGDLGPKNADMIDVETWMPSRGPTAPDSTPQGEYGETHSASRLYDYQCRRLDLRYRASADKKVLPCHSLNNTVVASPRILIPIMELYQNENGTITVPGVLRPHMGGLERIG
ncbi:MAG: serine--tRNA ligase [Phycisphaerae bacterium]|nr:serine--tRNA ligase [Phycisphaerae bacterium]